MNTQTSDSRGGLMVLLATGAIISAMFVVHQFPLATRQNLLSESGPFETLSAIGYALCITLMLVLWGLRATLRRWYFTAVFALFAARELDLDKKPFTEGLLKSRQYIGDTVSLGERAISALVLLAIIATVMTLLIREIGRFSRTLLRRSPAAIAVLAGLLFIVGSKMIDGLGRKLAPYGIELSDGMTQTLSLTEEIGEMGIPIMFAIAIYLSALRKKETI